MVTVSISSGLPGAVSIACACAMVMAGHLVVSVIGLPQDLYFGPIKAELCQPRQWHRLRCDERWLRCGHQRGI
jgi:hypothetical protein